MNFLGALMDGFEGKRLRYIEFSSVLGSSIAFSKLSLSALHMAGEETVLQSPKAASIRCRSAA
ncbi:MAG: hypothetical protein COB84_07385, partial [Rhodobacteraceae bacterium]